MKTVSYYLYLFSLAVAPIAFGTVEKWSLGALECLTVILFLCFILTSWHNRISLVKPVGLMIFLLYLGVLLLQLAPVPPAVLKILSPSGFDAYQPLLALNQDNGWLSISLNRRDTFNEFLRFGSYFLIYVLTVELLSTGNRFKSTINFVVFLAGALAFLAIIQHISSPDKIYWLRPVPSRSVPFGPWVNANQYAGYVEIVFPLALALFLFYKPRVRSEESLRQKFVNFFTMPGIHLHIYLGAAALVMFLSMFVSLSRGGILSLLFACFVFLILFNRKFPKHGKLTLLVFSICALSVVSWFGWDIIFSEFAQGIDSGGHLQDSRIGLWRDSWKMIKDFPIFGAGAGSFISVYPSYKSISDDLIYDHAHNEYIELLTDTGVIGFVLAALFVCSILYQCWKMVRARRDYYVVMIGIGAISGISAVLLHAVTDFNLHNGAVGFYFFFLCGVGVAAVHYRFSYTTPSSLLPKWPPRSCLRYFAFLTGFCLLVLLAQYGYYIASIRFQDIKSIYVNKNLASAKLEEVASGLRQAKFFDPLEGMYNFRLGFVSWFQGNEAEAKRQFLSAAFKQPMDGIYLQQLGFSNHEAQGKALVEEGYKRALFKDTLVLGYVDWLFGKKQREKALSLLQTRFQQNILDLYRWMPRFQGYDLTRDEIIAILPKNVEAWLIYAHFAEESGALIDAEFFFAKALDFLPGKNLQAKWFMKVIDFYQRNGKIEMLVDIARRGAENLPDSPVFHVILGDYYKDLGITYRAKEEYEQALMYDANNQQARRALRQLGFGDSY